MTKLFFVSSSSKKGKLFARRAINIITLISAEKRMKGKDKFFPLFFSFWIGRPIRRDQDSSRRERENEENNFFRWMTDSRNFEKKKKTGCWAFFLQNYYLIGNCRRGRLFFPSWRSCSRLNDHAPLGSPLIDLPQKLWNQFPFLSFFFLVVVVVYIKNNIERGGICSNESRRRAQISQGK